MLFTVGDFLKSIRSERGISLAQVAQVTHIKIRFLEALENNHYGVLPSEVQAKGFLRLYAGYLNIPEYPLIEAWKNRGSLYVTRTPAASGQQGEASDDFILEEAPPQPAAEDEMDAPNAADVSSAVADQFSIEIEEAVQTPAALDEQPNLSMEQVSLNIEPVSASSGAADGAGEDAGLPASTRYFREIGISLKSQREALGLTFDEIARYTHIRTQNLEAIEQGHIDRLPSPVQGQGMLSNYARFLEMDHDRLLSRYADGLQASRLEKLAELEDVKQNSRKRVAGAPPLWKQFITPDMIIGSSMILVLLAVSVWSVAQVTASKSKNNENIATAPSIAEMLRVSPSLLPPLLTETAQAAITPTRNYDNYEEMGAGQVQVQQAESLSQSELPPFENNDPLQLYVVPSQRAWIRITADNQVVFEGRVAPGNTYQYSAKNIINIRSGNASALRLYFNQQDMGEMGLLGQVIDVDFTSEGVITPTLTPTATATETPFVTETPALPTATLATPTITPFIP